MLVIAGMCSGYQLTVWACCYSWTREHMQGHGDVFQVHKWETNSPIPVSNVGATTEILVTLLRWRVFFFLSHLDLFLWKSCVLCSVLLFLLYEIKFVICWLFDWWNLDVMLHMSILTRMVCLELRFEECLLDNPLLYMTMPIHASFLTLHAVPILNLKFLSSAALCA